MCGRFAITAHDAATIAQGLAEDFGIELAPQQQRRLSRTHRARFNVAPSQTHWYLGESGEIGSGEWGFVIPGRSQRAFNARCETVDQRSIFRRPLREGRAVVVCSHFYEWNTLGSREPWAFQPQGQSYFALAALIEKAAHPAGEAVDLHRAFTLLTVPARGKIARLHPRMPALLGPAGVRAWLSPKTKALGAKALLRPAADSAMSAVQVDPWMNDPAHDDARCLQAPRQIQLF